MSVQQRRKYDKDFKRNAVRLTEEAGRTALEVAENLGIAADLLYRRRLAVMECMPIRVSTFWDILSDPEAVGIKMVISL